MLLDVAFITDFADQAVILPQALSVAAILSLQRRRQLLLLWLGAIGCVLGVTLVLKVLCRGFIGDPVWEALSSPSGHCAAAAVVYGAIGALLTPDWLHRSERFVVPCAVAASIAAAGAVGVTRVVLGAHSVSEALLGTIIGGLGAAAFGFLARREIVEGSGTGVLPAFVLSAVLFHGTHLSAEQLIRRIDQRGAFHVHAHAALGVHGDLAIWRRRWHLEERASESATHMSSAQCSIAVTGTIRA